MLNYFEITNVENHMTDNEFEHYMDKVFETIREKRKELGVSQGELSARMEKPQSSIARLEAGNVRDPRISMFFQVAKALEINPAEILGQAFDELEAKAGGKVKRKEKDKDWRLEKIKNRLDLLDPESKERMAEVIEAIFKLM